MGEISREYNQAEAQLYAHTAQTLSVHDLLLSDKFRNQAFFEALRQCITSESAVLDIGSGTGIWAVMAARLGARKVVAVERDQLLIGLIRRMARENGVADRVTVVNADSRQAQLDREFDVVVSETIGNVIFEEQIVPIMADARERFLKPGGQLIPAGVTLMVAPAHYPRPARLPAGISAEYDYFASLALNTPVALTNTDSLRIVGEARELVDVDLTSIASALDLTNLSASWESVDTSEMNCFATWAQLKLGDNLSISTMETSSWSTMIYRIRRFDGAHGDLNFKLSLTSITNYWTATLAHNGKQEVQSYSPANAATELLVQTRTDSNVLSHLQQHDLLGHTLKHAEVDSQ
jgi:protein-L-isoaspartate O-methyltransferase